MTKDNKKWVLKRNHSYFYQVQTQLHVTNRHYFDFVMWSKDSSIIKDRIETEETFFESINHNLQYFFTYGIMPELVGKWYTRKPVPCRFHRSCFSSFIHALLKLQKTLRNCGVTAILQVMHGTVIFCELEACPIQWFHCDCLRIRRPPKGK